MRNILLALLLALLMTACGSQATQPGTPAAETGEEEVEETENLLTDEVAIVEDETEEVAVETPQGTQEETPEETTGAAGGRAAGTENFPTDEVGIPDGDVAVTPTLEQTPSGSTLPETATSADESLTVRYPDGWFAESGTDNTVMISNEESLATSDLQVAPTSGQVVMQVGAIPREEYEESNIGLNQMTLVIGENLASSLGATGATFGEPNEGELNGLPMVTLTGSMTLEDQPVDVHIIVVDQQNDDAILQLIMLTANGESEEFEGTAQQVAGSANLGDVMGTQEADGGEGAAGGTAEISADNAEEAEGGTTTATPDAGDGTPDATEEAGS